LINPLKTLNPEVKSKLISGVKEKYEEELKEHMAKKDAED
jgi:hypothetical protein